MLSYADYMKIFVGLVAIVNPIGEQMLAFFGISVHSFRVGGGILILLVSVSMLHARTSGTAQTSDEARETAEKDSIAVEFIANGLKGLFPGLS